MLNYSEQHFSNTKLRIMIAERLHTERINAGLTLDELAEKSGYTKPTVQSWERGWKNHTGDNKIPTLTQLLDLSSLYGCTPEFLLCEYDTRTKNATDIGVQTGLLPESQAKLKEMIDIILYKDNPGANHLFLSFINYYISNCTLLNELIFNRGMLEDTRRALTEDKYYKELRDGFEKICAGSLSLEIFKDGAFSDEYLYDQFRKPMIDYYINDCGYSKSKAYKIMQHFKKHFDGLRIDHKLKQSDYAISSTFTDMIHSFFDDYPYNVFGDYDSYTNYLKERVNIES